MTNPYAPTALVSESDPSAAEADRRAKVPSVGFVVIGGTLLPGLPHIAMKRVRRGLALLCAVPTAFIFFGPVWGEWLFAGTPFREDGLYPFLCVLTLTPIASVAFGLMLRRRILEDATDLDPGFDPPS